jgi:sigma-B regulation protein RsbU (phosphoserine phosphatase)
MDERMNGALSGCLSMDEDHTILAVSQTLLDLLGYDLDGLRGCQFESILIRSSRIFFQIYFFPLIKLNGKIEEMHLSLKSANGIDVPVLLSAVRRECEGRFVHECVLSCIGEAANPGQRGFLT